MSVPKQLTMRRISPRRSVKGCRGWANEALRRRREQKKLHSPTPMSGNGMKLVFFAGPSPSLHYAQDERETSAHAERSRGAAKSKRRNLSLTSRHRPMSGRGSTSPRQGLFLPQRRRNDSESQS